MTGSANVGPSGDFNGTAVGTGPANAVGSAQSPGNTNYGGGTGTGSHGPLFWFYVGLGIGFLAWLIFAIYHTAKRHRQLRRQDRQIQARRRRVRRPSHA